MPGTSRQVMALRDAALEIFNGARCKTYRWSQSHSDLEVRIELEGPVRYENLKVDVTSDNLKVNLVSSIDTIEGKEKTIVEGQFEDQIDPESVYWVLDTEGKPCLIMYMDKVRGKWWNKLLKNEEATEKGPINYVIDMEDLGEGSRMAIEKLVYEQKSKLDLQDGDDFSLV